jgi:hypothetical protein
MKILYAAGNRLGSFFQLKRFLDSVKDQNHKIKIAAYKKSMGTLDIDYTLDSLLNFSSPESGMSFNGNYKYYYNEIKRFAPDLIISDFEIYTSIIALEANIKLWQVSPVLLYNALYDELKNMLGIYKNHAYLVAHNLVKKEYLNHILNNSDKKFVLSHLCDIESPPILLTGYEWARPEFILGNKSNDKIDYVVTAIENNKDIVEELKNKNAVIFSNFSYERYPKMKVKNIYDELEYRQYIDNCKLYISDGTAIFLADAFYNQKFCITVPRYDDIEPIIASYINTHYGISKISTENFNIELPKINISINDDVKFISEHLGEL